MQCAFQQHMGIPCSGEMFLICIACVNGWGQRRNQQSDMRLQPIVHVCPNLRTEAAHRAQHFCHFTCSGCHAAVHFADWQGHRFLFFNGHHVHDMPFLKATGMRKTGHYPFFAQCVNEFLLPRCIVHHEQKRGDEFIGSQGRENLGHTIFAHRHDNQIIMVFFVQVVHDW